MVAVGAIRRSKLHRTATGSREDIRNRGKVIHRSRATRLNKDTGVLLSKDIRLNKGMRRRDMRSSNKAIRHNRATRLSKDTGVRLSTAANSTLTLKVAVLKVVEDTGSRA
jgi:type II secretory pathway component PulF